MPHANTDDVRTVLLRDLTDVELDLAERLVVVAASILRRRIPDLDERISTDLDFGDLVSYVEAKAVARVLRNPEGVTYETIGPFAQQRPASSASEDGVSFTKAELSMLGIGSGAFTITPYMERPTLGVSEVPPPWFSDFPSSDGSL